MKDEIKIPENVLVSLGNLQSGALNYYKAPKTIEVYKNTILDYITNLKQRCEYLERSNNRREDEIMSLRDECVDGETYKSRIDKAIEYINNDLLICVLPNNQIINGNEVVKRINYIENILNGDEE